MSSSITGIFICPVKSLRGIEVQQATVTKRGLAHDRRWMVVDQGNVFMTQREHPLMATIETTVTEDERLILSDGTRQIEVPGYDAFEHRLDDYRVWDSVVPAAHLSKDVDQFLSDALSTPCSLVFMPETTRRTMDPDYATEDEIVSFADGFPILLTNTASLNELCRRAGETIDMDRFRPNIVVGGMDAFAEDDLGRFRLGDAILEGVKPCARCAITTIDQATGERLGKEPLKTLATFRRRDGKVLFGENLAVRSPGQIRIGDTIEPLAPRGIFPMARPFSDMKAQP